MVYVVVYDSRWTSHLKKCGVFAWYMNYGFVPGAFSGSDGIIHVKKSAWDAACVGKKWAVLLLAHELGHIRAVPLHNHPTKIIAGLQHAINVNFDVRAFSRVVRLRAGNYHRLVSETCVLIEREKEYVKVI